MGVPTSEVGYTTAMPRKEDHEVHKDMWWHWIKRNISLKIRTFTGRFIIYSGITKIYYRKTLGHVFTKPIQIEGTTQYLFPVICFSS
jgi:hypothetical protein